MAIRATYIALFELRLNSAPTDARGHEHANFRGFYTAHMVKFENHRIS
jgi:hypothetical protein